MSCFAPFRRHAWMSACLLVLAVPVLPAADVSYTISGKITSAVVTQSVSDAYGVGTPYSLVVVWDAAAAPTSLSSTQGQYRLKELTLTLGGTTTWSTSAVETTYAPSFGVGYENGGAVDSMQFTSGWGPDSHTNKTIGDLQSYSVNLTLADPTGTALPTLDSAPGALSLDAWSTNVSHSYLKFYLNNDGNQFLLGDVASIESTASGPSTPDVTGDATVVGIDIVHPNGRRYDQLLLTGTTASLTANPGDVTRISFLDLNDDIVQVEFAGAGTLTINLENATGPATPSKYTQPDVNYMKGHASISIAGADETTNVSVFSVGRLNAFDPTGTYDMLEPAGAENDPVQNASPLFVGHGATEYDGFADIASIVIESANGRFGGIRAANASFLATAGVTGIVAPGITFDGPVFVHDIHATDTAVPSLLLGLADDVRITGGSLAQGNNADVRVSGIVALTFTAGASSHNVLFPAQANQAKLVEDGVDITSQIVVNPETPGDPDTGPLETKELTFAFNGANPPYTNGSKKTFQFSMTTLKFDDKTLTNPTTMNLNPPMTGVRFTDEDTGFVWEVYFRDGALHEINIMRNGQFAGQWD